jgi:hypothetical protein
MYGSLTLRSNHVWDLRSSASMVTLNSEGSGSGATMRCGGNSFANTCTRYAVRLSPRLTCAVSVFCFVELSGVGYSKRSGTLHVDFQTRRCTLKPNAQMIARDSVGALSVPTPGVVCSR